MADWDEPTVTTDYDVVFTIINGKFEDSAKMFDGSTSTNIPTGAYRIRGSGANELEKFNGSSWDLQTLKLSAVTATTFTGNLTGTASAATTASVATAITVASETSDTTCFPVFATASSGNMAPKVNTSFTFDAASGRVGVEGQITSKALQAATATVNFKAEALGSAQGEKVGVSFFPTFEGTADDGARRAADIWSGFDGGSWGSEYIVLGVGRDGAGNDAQTVTIEKLRITDDKVRSAVRVFAGLVDDIDTSGISGSLIVGGDGDGAHISLNHNEIVAKSDETTPSTLYLNFDGGVVNVGSGGIESTGPVNSNVKLNTKVIDIPAWNMLSAQNLAVTHGLSLSKIKTVTAMITNDSGTLKSCFPSINVVSASSNEYIDIDGTNINLVRADDGFFDNTAYDSTSNPRGSLVIQYID
jgi:hypothetical protein